MATRDSEKACPKRGSASGVGVPRGMPHAGDQPEGDLGEGRAVLEGCRASEADPEPHRKGCSCELGSNPKALEGRKRGRKEQLRSIIYGAAVGDALGVPYEFMERDSFECTEMSDGGIHRMPKGTFSDDSSMLLATCDSIKERGGIDVEDMRKRFCLWLYEGKYTADGTAFDVGNATATALDRGYGCSHERSNGNGSLMRIAPLALVKASDADIEAAPAITHAHPMSKTACRVFVHILREVLQGAALETSLATKVADDERFSFMEGLEDAARDDIRSSGFVLDTLGAALWCALHTDSYAACVLEAVNLGNDSDTTACVAGALAGAMYGYDSIPQAWITALRGKGVIDGCLFS